MTTPNDIVERMAEINPVPDPTTVDESRLGALASLVEERRSAVVGARAPERRGAPARSRAVLAFTSALILVLLAVGVVAILPGGGADVAGEPSAPTTTPLITATPAAVARAICSGREAARASTMPAT